MDTHNKHKPQAISETHTTCPWTGLHLHERARNKQPSFRHVRRRLCSGMCKHPNIAWCVCVWVGAWGRLCAFRYLQRRRCSGFCAWMCVRIHIFILHIFDGAVRMHIFMHACVRAHVYKRTCIHAFVRHTYIHTYMPTCSLTHKHAYTLAHTRAHTHTHIHSCRTPARWGAAGGEGKRGQPLVLLLWTS